MKTQEIFTLLGSGHQPTHDKHFKKQQIRRTKTEKNNGTREDQQKKTRCQEKTQRAEKKKRGHPKD